MIWRKPSVLTGCRSRPIITTKRGTRCRGSGSPRPPSVSRMTRTARTFPEPARTADAADSTNAIDPRTPRRSGRGGRRGGRPRMARRRRDHQPRAPRRGRRPGRSTAPPAAEARRRPPGSSADRSVATEVPGDLLEVVAAGRESAPSQSPGRRRRSHPRIRESGDLAALAAVLVEEEQPGPFDEHEGRPARRIASKHRGRRMGVPRRESRLARTSASPRRPPGGGHQQSDHADLGGPPAPPRCHAESMPPTPPPIDR